MKVYLQTRFAIRALVLCQKNVRGHGTGVAFWAQHFRTDETPQQRKCPISVYLERRFMLQLAYGIVIVIVIVNTLDRSDISNI